MIGNGTVTLALVLTSYANIVDDATVRVVGCSLEVSLVTKLRIGMALCVLGIAAGCSGQEAGSPLEETPSLADDIGQTNQSATNCPSVTETLDEQVTHGRAVKKDVTFLFWTVTGYYAVRAPNKAAATEYLGADGNLRVTLYVTDEVQRSWTADPNACRDSPICGDGKRNVTSTWDELCEGADLGGETCASRGFSGGGTLACTPDCGFDTSDCENTCGNGITEHGEDCDGGITGDPSCENYISYRYIGGDLKCGADCRFDTSECVTPSCGNGVIEIGEDCDGTTFGNIKACSDYNVGWESGTLGCDDRCQFDFSDCVSKCGNGVLDDFEECDGDLWSSRYAGKSCRNIQNPNRLFPFDIPVNYASGELRCEGCSIRLNECLPAPGCYIVRAKLPTIRCY